MRSSPPSDESLEQCRICHATLASDSASSCATCGASVDQTPADELRHVSYLLSELDRWKAGDMIDAAQADALREIYEDRRDHLRTQLASDNGKNSTLSSQPATISRQPEPNVLAPHPTLQSSPTRPPLTQKPQRTLVETLTDPRTLRLLLYTGASMFVVGVVIWLRDVLYLKLQEPHVQAALLASGTFLITISGWYTILRTRLRLTGRALTLTGAILFPVNFWFLVRSGLVANNGRAWIVCAVCAALYAHKALLLRERLYVYLACAASVMIPWALIFRAEREAFSLYALALMVASLVFLHLLHLFPRSADNGRWTMDDKRKAHRLWSMVYGPSGVYRPFDGELWSAPLTHAALFGATLSALVYMPLRARSSSSLYDEAFQLRGNDYDSGIAILLFSAGAYVAWFAGRYIYAQRRVALYTTAALALLWTEFLALDGLRASGSIQILALALTTTASAIWSRYAQSVDLATSLHQASLIVSLLLAPAAFVVLSNTTAVALTQSASFALIAATFAALSAPRFCGRAAQAALAYGSALFASAAFLAALASLNLQSASLISAACSLWPFALYASAQLARKQKRETQLVEPFVRVADAEFILLLLWGSLLALVQHLADGRLLGSRASMFYLLSASVVYGALQRSWRERSVFGAAMASVAMLLVVAATGDALKEFDLLPAAWPVATAVICAAFLIQNIAGRWFNFQEKREHALNEKRSPEVAVRLVMDFAVTVCALLWFTTALIFISDGGYAAASVLLLALVYWMVRAARRRASSLAHIATMHAGALFIALLIALRVDTKWFAMLIALILYPGFFALGRRARGSEWLAMPAVVAAIVAAALAFVIAMIQAGPHLRAGDPLLFAPCVAIAAIALVSLMASLLSERQSRVRYFRACLYATVIAFSLGCLRGGFEPLRDAEVYTTPVAILLLVTALVSVRREWKEYDADVDALLWAGSLLLCGPLLLRAIHFRLLLDEPAPWRDLSVLSASLLLLLFGVMGRLRAPVMVGALTLTTELMLLALTSVEWAQVPLKYYLITVGALLLLVFGMFEYRREQLLLVRERFHRRREYARERFGEWR